MSYLACCAVCIAANNRSSQLNVYTASERDAAPHQPPNTGSSCRRQAVEQEKLTPCLNVKRRERRCGSLECSNLLKRNMRTQRVFNCIERTRCGMHAREATRTTVTEVLQFVQVNYHFFKKTIKSYTLLCALVGTLFINMVCTVVRKGRCGQ